jgi:hypothetical protein
MRFLDIFSLLCKQSELKRVPPRAGFVPQVMDGFFEKKELIDWWPLILPKLQRSLA